MFLRISAYLCVHPTQNPLTGSSQATQSFIWRGPEWRRSSLLLMPSVINGLRSSAREKPGRRSDRTPLPGRRAGCQFLQGTVTPHGARRKDARRDWFNRAPFLRRFLEIVLAALYHGPAFHNSIVESGRQF